MLGAGFGLCDSNNALKLGHDPMQQRWPGWLDELLPTDILPQVVEPGSPIGRLHPELAERWGLTQPVSIIAGTTDSTAAVIATGAKQVGQAVTSLGSTLVMKVISDRPIFAPQHGVYSQPYRGRWLVGGGSNSGGAVLRHYFSDSQLAELTPRLHPETPSGLDYMPLLRPGERFPVNDPKLAPRLSPRPEDDALFLQGLLEAMARIEADAYRRLADLGAPWPSSVISIGGGAKNPAWCQIRKQILGLEVTIAARQQAAYGTALLALGAKPSSAC
jgi:sugar (pentulose or hexulose) kinase